MKRFLRESIRDLPDALKSKNVHIVIGNEASDADSIISSITYAYYLQQKRVWVDSPSLFSLCDTGCESSELDCTKGFCVPVNTHIIPLLSINSDDINIRPDVKLIFQKIGLVPRGLLSFNEFMHSYSNSGSKSDVSISLVDHNTLSAAMKTSLDETLSACQIADSTYAKPSYRVSNILDHHKDQLLYITSPSDTKCLDQSYLPLSEGNVTSTASTSTSPTTTTTTTATATPLRNIAYDNAAKKETAGSCCSLILEEYQSTAIGRYLLDMKGDSICDGDGDGSSIITTLLCVLLLDTCNLNPNRTSPRDHVAMKFLLERHLTAYPSSISGNHMFNELSSAKSNVEFWKQLSIVDVLRLDYKMFPVLAPPMAKPLTFGISSIMIPMQLFFQQGEPQPQTETETETEREHVSLALSVYDSIMAKMSSNGLCGYAVTTMFCGNSPVYNRELCIFFPSDGTGGIKSKMIEYCAHSAKEFQFQEVVEILIDNIQSDKTMNVLYYKQNNSGLSRKQIAPLLQHFSSW